MKRIDWFIIWKMEEFILLPAVDTMMTKFIAPSSFTVKVHHVFSNVGMIIESIIILANRSDVSLDDIERLR